MGQPPPLSHQSLYEGKDFWDGHQALLKIRSSFLMTLQWNVRLCPNSSGASQAAIINDFRIRRLV